MEAAGLIINENDAAPNHRGNEHSQHNDARKQKLDIGHVGINFNDVQSGRRTHARRNRLGVVCRQERVENAFQG